MFFLDELRKSNITNNLNTIFEIMYYNSTKFINFPHAVPGKPLSAIGTSYEIGFGLLLIRTDHEILRLPTYLCMQISPWQMMNDNLCICRLLLKYHSEITINFIKSKPLSCLRLVNVDDVFDSCIPEKPEYYSGIYVLKDPNNYKSCWFLTKINGGFSKTSVDFMGNPLFDIGFGFESAMRLSDDYFDIINNYQQLKKFEDFVDLIKTILEENEIDKRLNKGGDICQR